MGDDSLDQVAPTPERITFTEREEVLITEAVQRIFPNVKIYMDEKLQEVFEILKELQDIRNNMATFSTILASKGVFSKEEYRECHSEIVRSFGVVSDEWFMEGKVSVTDFNFGRKRK